MFDDLLHIFYPREYTLGNGKVVKEKFNPAPYITIAVIIVTVYFINFTGLSLTKLVNRFHFFFEMLGQMFPPRWAFWAEMKKAMWDTIVMSFLGTAFGCLLALPLSFYLSNNFKLPNWYLKGHKAVLSIFRTLPTLIYARLLSIIIGAGTLSGTISIAIFTYTIAVKMMYEQIETIDMGPYEAMESTGATRMQCITCAAFPQVRGFYWSTVLYCFETNVRSAAILGYVGAGGIGVLMNAQLSWRNYDNAGLMVLVLVITVVVIETISREIRKKLIQG
ncbi:MAG: phosphonate ABC transporter, permease protein PhnE [Erysipelotrichaceae bacterium]|nr:phosphonate ABC transporter, permease protein PhnE [Erysipelotrichaceae bacterium]